MLNNAGNSRLKINPLLTKITPTSSCPLQSSINQTADASLLPFRLVIKYTVDELWDLNSCQQLAPRIMFYECWLSSVWWTSRSLFDLWLGLFLWGSPPLQLSPRAAEKTHILCCILQTIPSACRAASNAAMPNEFQCEQVFDYRTTLYIIHCTKLCASHTVYLR